MQGEARRPPDSLQTGETFAKKGKHVQEEETWNKAEELRFLSDHQVLDLELLFKSNQHKEKSFNVH